MKIFGSGYALATLGHILHSEGEALSRKLLAKTFNALGERRHHRRSGIPSEQRTKWAAERPLLRRQHARQYI